VAREKLRQVGLAGSRSGCRAASGGQQQRVAVARAIVLEPEVLLFDEPLSNLDAKLRRHVRDEIRALQQTLKLTVCCEHDQQEALAVSDRVIVMNAGRIAQDGSPRELYEQPVSRFVADFIGDANLMPVTVCASMMPPPREPGRGYAEPAAARPGRRDCGAGGAAAGAAAGARDDRAGAARAYPQGLLPRQPHGIRSGIGRDRRRVLHQRPGRGPPLVEGDAAGILVDAAAVALVRRSDRRLDGSGA